MSKPLVIKQRSDLTQLFKSVSHTFDGAGDEAVIKTSINLGEVKDAGGGIHAGVFDTTYSAAPLKPLDDDTSVEPTPVNRVYLMTRCQNSLLEQIEKTFLDLDVTEVGGVELDMSAFREE